MIYGIRKLKQVTLVISTFILICVGHYSEIRQCDSEQFSFSHMGRDHMNDVSGKTRKISVDFHVLTLNNHVLGACRQVYFSRIFLLPK